MTIFYFFADGSRLGKTARRGLISVPSFRRVNGIITQKYNACQAGVGRNIKSRFASLCDGGRAESRGAQARRIPWHIVCRRHMKKTLFEKCFIVCMPEQGWTGASRCCIIKAKAAGAGRISAADGASAGAMHRCSLYFYEAMGAKKCLHWLTTGNRAVFERTD